MKKKQAEHDNSVLPTVVQHTVSLLNLEYLEYSLRLLLLVMDGGRDGHVDGRTERHEFASKKRDAGGSEPRESGRGEIDDPNINLLFHSMLQRAK